MLQRPRSPTTFGTQLYGVGQAIGRQDDLKVGPVAKNTSNSPSTSGKRKERKTNPGSSPSALKLM